MIALAHVGDTHLDDHPWSAERTARIMQYLHALPRRPDAVPVTGDIADHGAPGAGFHIFDDTGRLTTHYRLVV